MKNKINVLSLFDGMSCGQIALKELGVGVGKYYASEIDKHAMKVADHNFPETIQLGDVTNWKDWGINFLEIDLVLAGSPCQGFSFAGKQLAFDDPRSKLFFVFIDILNHIKKRNPNVKFLLENVKMKKEHENIISKFTGISPIEINSALVSAQNRKRLYWTNIKNEPYGLFGDMKCTIPQPKDRGILLRDILEDEVDDKYYLSEKIVNSIRKWNSTDNPLNRVLTGDEKTRAATARGIGEFHSDMTLIAASRGRNPENPKSRKRGLNTKQHLEPRNDGKTNCLTSVKKDNLVIQVNNSKESAGKQPYQQNRVYHTNGISPALCSGLGKGNAIIVPEANKKGFVEIKPGDLFDFEYPESNTRRGRKMQRKSNCLMAKNYLQLKGGFDSDNRFYKGDSKHAACLTKGQNKTGYFDGQKLRRLTSLECQRLQTVPEWFDMSVVSDTQRYKMLGNGWTIEVIKHILNYM